MLATPPAPAGVRDFDDGKMHGLPNRTLSLEQLAVSPDADKISLEFSRDDFFSILDALLELQSETPAAPLPTTDEVEDSLRESRSDGHDWEDGGGGCWYFVADEEDVDGEVAAADGVLLAVAVVGVIPVLFFAPAPEVVVATLPLRLMLAELPVIPLLAAEFADAPLWDSHLLTVSVNFVAVFVPEPLPFPFSISEEGFSVGVGMSEHEDCAWFTSSRAHLQ